MALNPEWSLDGSSTGNVNHVKSKSENPDKNELPVAWRSRGTHSRPYGFSKTLKEFRLGKRKSSPYVV